MTIKAGHSRDQKNIMSVKAVYSHDIIWVLF